MIDFIQMADAVTVILKSGSFCLPAIFERVIIPQFTAAEQAAGTLKVSVVPKEFDSEILTRGSDMDEHKIDIGIQKKVSDIEAEVPKLLIFVKEIIKFLKHKNLPTKPAAQYISLANKPIYDVKHLSEEKVFTTVITITYKAAD
jgi:hypothetical protein